MRKLHRDPEIAAIIPDPVLLLPEDDKAVNVGNEPLPLGLDPKEAWMSALRESIRASKKPVVHVIVWKGKDIIIDGIARYRICRELGIEPKVEEIELADKRAAIQERWRRNITTLRNLTDFAVAEQVYRYWDQYLQPQWEASLKGHQGGRGKKVDSARNRLKEQAKMARLGPTTMYHVQWLLDYEQKPFSLDQEAEGVRRLPDEEVNERLRQLRNGTALITSVQRSFKSFDTRWNRKIKNKAARNALLPSAAPDFTGLRTSWTGELNTTIHGDVIDILKQVPENVIDRFVFSPPYYLTDETSGDYIDYGGGFTPFRSWDHYCNWTFRYLAEMWRILPEGGFIVVNIDNTRNPQTQRFYYHSDMIRHLMSFIHIPPQCLGSGTNNPVLGALLTDDTLNPLLVPAFYDHEATPRNVRKRIEARYKGKVTFFIHAHDCGEYIWSKYNSAAKKAARGSTSMPARRPEHEYVLFFRKGEADEQASTMLERELNEMTLSAWEPKQWKELAAYEQRVWGSYWKIASRSSKGHAATFPPDLAYRMVKYGGSLTDTICDPFCGTGTALHIAARLGRKYLGIDVNPKNAQDSEKAGKRGEREFAAANPTQ